MSRQTPVAEVMSTDLLTFTPGDTVSSAMESLVARGVDGAPVVDSDGVPIGVLTVSDLIVQGASLHFPTVISVLGATIELPSSKRNFEDDLRRTLGSTVADVMRPDPVTLDVSATVAQAATLLHDHDISRLPVVDEEGKLVGLIARADVLRAIMNRGASS